MKKTLNVMVVEDSPQARSALRAFISSQEGITIAGEASNGLEAINLIGRQTPDVVLMDVRMPVMDGLEATKIIKKHWPRIKIVLLSMYANFQSDAVLAGADAFLVKGCPVGKMMTIIRAPVQTKMGVHVE